jgi:hypothetical protein
MPKLSPEQHQHLINQFTTQIDALNESLPETMTLYDLEKSVEHTGKQILNSTLETLTSNQSVRISPSMPALPQANPKKRCNPR